jgi:NADPH:quinone reductase-like Zn-dependent oxidoreductase
MKLVTDLLAPPLGPKQILVKIKAVPINAIDVMYPQGAFPLGHPVPCVNGFEGAGTVADVGKDVNKNLVGKNVAVWFDSTINSGTW